jgi:adenylate cyclase
MKEKATYLVPLLLVFFCMFYIKTNQLEPFESFSLKFNDINFKLQHKKINKDIVFVAIDEPSVNKFGRWPWDREVIAKGVSYLSKADVVLFDMIFSETTTSKADNDLANTISSLNNSVCGFFLRKNSTQDVTDEELDILQDSSLDLLQSQISQYKNPIFISSKYAELNILPILSACTFSGSFSTLSENDNLLRSYPISVYYKDSLYPSLAIQGLRLKFNKDIKRVDINHVDIAGKIIGLDKKGFIRLNFYDKDQYKIISFLDVIEQKIKPEYFKNKIVILGITEVGAGDIVSTPIGTIPGALLHYTFLSNVLENHMIQEPLYLSYILLFFMILLPLIVLFISKKIFYRVIINISVYIVLYISVRYLFVLKMIYIDLFYPLVSLILSIFVIEFIAFNLQERSARFIKNAFSSYLSEELLDKLVENPDSLMLGGEKKNLTILFSDIRGFTTISESMDPIKLIGLLNRYFTPMTKSVLDYNGMLDKYIGDALMAFFNAPLDLKNHTDAACYCALEMQERLKILNLELEAEGLIPIEIGIGINTDEVVVGNMGSDTRFNYTVIGDGVNVASRVEGLSKEYGVGILLTESSIKNLKDDFIYRKIEVVKLKGKNGNILVYELMPNTQMSKDIKKLYDNALSIYINDDISKAHKLFEEIVMKYDDVLSKYFLNKISLGLKCGVNKMMNK